MASTSWRKKHGSGAALSNASQGYWPVLAGAICKSFGTWSSAATGSVHCATQMAAPSELSHTSPAGQVTASQGSTQAPAWQIVPLGQAPPQGLTFWQTGEPFTFTQTSPGEQAMI